VSIIPEASLESALKIEEWTIPCYPWDRVYKGIMSMKSYVFQVELAHEDAGRWSAWIDVLPGWAVWGYNKKEVLQAIQVAAGACIKDMQVDI
jgi:hypothetical protein